MAKAGTAILAMDDPDQEALARVALLASDWSVRVFYHRGSVANVRVMDIAFGTAVDTLTGPSGPAAA